MTLKEYMRTRMFAYTGGISQGGSPDEVSRLTLIGNEDAIKDAKLREYGVWWRGDGDELLNFYSKETLVEFATEPFYWRNKRSYFYSISSTEDDVKRTHSGQPYNIVTTLVGLVGKPTVSMEAMPKTSIYSRMTAGSQDNTLADILDGCGFWDIYSNEQMPMTLVEGWGCYKISWDLRFSDHPFITYYTAQNVDFSYRAGKITGIMFRDWYVGEDGRKRYLVTEFRYLTPRRDENGFMTRDLTIETEAWQATGGGQTTNDAVITKVSLDDIPELRGVEGKVVIRDFDSLLAAPCVFYKDAKDTSLPGKSIYSTKIELFDDLDQALSQQSNAVRRSTPEELFNSDFLERDPHTHLPKQPKVYDRKFISYSGGRDSNGAVNTSEPVQVTQPNINFSQYGEAAVQILSQILAGIMSPATMGIGVAAAATQESQREKEKITVTTRNHIIEREGDILRTLFSDVLCCEEYLRTGKITQRKHDVTIKFSEFADNTFEEKSAVLADALAGGSMSPEMFMDKLYGDTLSDEDYRAELEFLKQSHAPAPDMMGGTPPDGSADIPLV